MANQYKNLSNFKAYKARIFEYLSEEIIKLPGFFRFQPQLTGIQPDPNSNTDGGVAQQTIRAGQITKNRKITESLLVYDNSASQHPEDDDIVTNIAYSLQGLEPGPETIKIGLYVWVGFGDIVGPFYSTNVTAEASTIAQTLRQGSVNQIGYLPFARIEGQTDFLIAPTSLPRIYEAISSGPLGQVPNSIHTYDEFITLVKEKGFNIDSNYNIADNTSQFLPVGTKKRTISKKLLSDTSDTTISELIPITNQYRIEQFFKQWKKIQSIIPLGQEYIAGNSFINNGDFSGGVGPGILTNVWEDTPSVPFASSGIPGSEDQVTPDGNPILINYPETTDGTTERAVWDSFIFTLSELFSSQPNSTWLFQNRNLARASQQIEEYENPGFSPFVFSSQRNSPTSFSIKIENLGYTPNLDYTISAWVSEEEQYNPLNYFGLRPENIFFYRVVAYEPNSPDVIAEVIKNWPSKEASTLSELESGTNFTTGMQGEEVQTWNGETSQWTRYKHTFNYTGFNSDGELIDLSQYPGGLKVRIEWRLAYQNSVSGFLNSGTPDEVDSGVVPPYFFFPGPTMYANNNQAKQYYTGLRLNIGSEISGLNKIELTDNNPDTITSLMQNCIDLLSPQGEQIPLYSQNQLETLVNAQEASTQIISLLNEIKNGLIKAIDDLSRQFGEVIPALVQTFTQDATQVPPVETDAAAESKLAVETALAESNLPFAIETLSNQFDAIYNALIVNDANLIGENVDTISHSPYIQNLNGEERGLPYNVGLNERYTIFDDNWMGEAHYLDLGDGPEEQDNPILSNEGKPEFNKNAFVLDSVMVTAAGYDNMQALNNNVNLGNSTVNPERHQIHGIPVRYTTDYDGYLGESGDNYPILTDVFQPMNGQTPIAAMYHSEMTNYNANLSKRGGPFVQDSNIPEEVQNPIGNQPSYFNNYFNYPNCEYTYGPYAALNSPNSVFGTNPISRVSGIMEAYVARLQTDNVYGINFNQQFQGMTEDGGQINGNFEPLKEYVYVTGRGREWMLMVHPQYAANTNTLWQKEQVHNSSYLSSLLNDSSMNTALQIAASGTGGFEPAFGMISLQNPNYGDLSGAQIRTEMLYQQGNRFPLGYNKTMLDGDGNVKGDYYHGMVDYNGGEVTGLYAELSDYLQYHRFYEPHWEWNPNKGVNGEWVFRFAQPVIGSTAMIGGVSLDDDRHPLNGFGGRYGNSTITKAPELYMGERKYKFKSMKIYQI